MMKTKINTRLPVLYCGDDDLRQGARYLYGVLGRLGYKIKYLPSRRQLRLADLRECFSAIILSDYPGVMIPSAVAAKIAAQVRSGTGFLMIGGWGSFHGYDGNYQRTRIAEILPVRIKPADDRADLPQGAIIIPKTGSAAIFPGLNFRTSAIIGGYNKVTLKPGSQLYLAVRNLEIKFPRIQMTGREYPLLAAGQYGSGRTACYLSDLAPHWAGGLVDWGRKKVRIRCAGGNYMEVGAQYFTFIRQLLALITKR